MKHYILILFIGITSTLHGQKQDSASYNIKLNVPALVDIFTFPTLELSVEKKISVRSSLSLEAGYQFYNLMRTDTVHLKPRGFKVNIEYRYYLFKWLIVKGKLAPYVGLQAFYRKNQMTEFIEYTSQTDPESHKDYFGVKKSIPGLNLKGGFQIILKKVVMDVYVGIGPANRTTKNTNIEYRENSGDDLEGEYAFTENANLESQSRWIVNVTGGVRFGWIF